MRAIKKKVVNFKRKNDDYARLVQGRLDRAFKLRKRERRASSNITLTNSQKDRVENILFSFEKQMEKLVELYLMKDTPGFVSGYAHGKWQMSGLKRPDLKPINLFKALSYALICETIETVDGRSAIELLYSAKIIGLRAPTFDENPFYAGLRSAGPDNAMKRGEDREELFLSQHELGLFSRQMLYAYDRGVPPGNLCGFLFQSGFSNRISNEDVSAGTELTHMFNIPKEIRDIDPLE